jgi:hypothetical protein
MQFPNRETFRVIPGMPVQAMRTYGISSPIATHYRRATCAEVECGPTVNGWKSLADESTPDGQRRAHYIRKQSGRHFSEGREGSLTVFWFPPGQMCFDSGNDQHMVSLERPATFLVRDGDWRGNPSGSRRVHQRPEDWVEDFAENLDQVKTQIERG